MTSDKSIKRSRGLLGVYWLYKVLNGGNIAKTTLNALKIEANAALLHIPITIFETDIFEVANSEEIENGKKAKSARLAELLAKLR